MFQSNIFFLILTDCQISFAMSLYAVFIFIVVGPLVDPSYHNPVAAEMLAELIITSAQMCAQVKFGIIRCLFHCLIDRTARQACQIHGLTMLYLPQVDKNVLASMFPKYLYGELYRVIEKIVINFGNSW